MPALGLKQPCAPGGVLQQQPATHLVAAHNRGAVARQDLLDAVKLRHGEADAAQRGVVLGRHPPGGVELGTVQAGGCHYYAARNDVATGLLIVHGVARVTRG